MARGSRRPQTAHRRVVQGDFHPHVETDRHGGHYGYGWFIDQFAGTKRIYHNGGTRGFRIAAQMFPERRAAILIQLNSDGDDDMTPVGESVAKLLIFNNQEQ